MIVFKEDTGIHTFPKGISSKVNVIARLEFKLVYFEAVVSHTPVLTGGFSLICLQMVIIISFLKQYSCLK